MRDTVDEVGRAASEDGIDCDYAKGGTLSLVTNPAHERRIREHAPTATWLDGRRGSARGSTPRCDRRRRSPPTAPPSTRPSSSAGSPPRSNDAACASSSRPRAVEIEPGRRAHRRRHDRGPRSVLRCTEGYTPTLRGERRTLVPLYSLMIATEPLPDDDLGRDRAPRSRDVHRRTTPAHLRPTHRRRPIRLRWPRRARTTSGRASGRPSTATPGCSTPSSASCAGSSLRSATPRSPTDGAARSACPATGRHRSASTGVSGLGWAGGYVGDGVATTNLAGPHARRPGAAPRHRADPPAVGRTTAAASGSPSRSAGSASTPVAPSAAAPTAPRNALGGRIGCGAESWTGSWAERARVDTCHALLLRRGHVRRHALRPPRPGRRRLRVGTPSSSPTRSATPRSPTRRYPYTADGNREFLDGKPFIEPFVLIPALAAVTTRLRFATFVVKLAIRQPVLVAKQAASVAVHVGQPLLGSASGSARGPRTSSSPAPSGRAGASGWTR